MSGTRRGNSLRSFVSMIMILILGVVAVAGSAGGFSIFPSVLVEGRLLCAVPS